MRLRAALQQQGCEVTGSDGSMLARCPAHEDDGRSLSIIAGEDGVAVVCEAGCQVEAVMAALGVPLRDRTVDAGLRSGEDGQGSGVATEDRVGPADRSAGQGMLRCSCGEEDGTAQVGIHAVECRSGVSCGDGAGSRGGGRGRMGAADPTADRRSAFIDAVASGAPVFIVGSERCVDALAAVGLVATTVPSEDGPGRAQWRACFAGAARVVVLPHNDPQSAASADAVVSELDGVAEELLVVSLPGLAHGAGVADWLQAGGTAQQLRDAVCRARRAQGAVVGEGLTVIGRSAGRPATWRWPEPLAGHVYAHTAAGEWAAYLDEARITEADPAAVFVQTLTGLAAMIGIGPHLRRGVSVWPPRWFALVVGQTSRARKGTSWEAAGALLRAVDGDFLTQRTRSGFGSGEALLGPMADPPEAHAQGQGRPAAGPDRRLLVVETEFARVLDVAERHGSTLSANLRDLFDSGPVRNLVKGQSVTVAEHHCALIGHITVEELRSRLSSSAIGNGFGNRLLLVGAVRPRLLPHPAQVDDGVLRPLAARLRDALEAARKRAEVTLTPDAEQRWGELYVAMEQRPLPPLAAAMTGRTAVQTLRIALATALLAGKDMVDRADLEVAAEVVRYSVDTVLHIFGDQLGDERAQQLLHAAREAGHRGINGTQRAALFSRNARAGQLTRAVRLLTELRLCDLIRVPSKGGRPSEILVAAEHLEEAIIHYRPHSTPTVGD